MAWVISFESFRAVIALVFLWIEFSSSWTSNAIFAVPERKVWWTVAGLIWLIPNSSSSLLIGWAFANVISAKLPWKFTWNSAVACFGGVVVYVIGWAWSASLLNCVKDVWSVALSTVVIDFNEALLTTRLDFVIIPWRIRARESFSCLSWNKHHQDSEESEFCNKICHLIKRIN